MITLLIGPRGCGKTSVGHGVAAAAGLAFIDLDERVLARFPQPTVQAVFADRGEAAWRSAELAALREVLELGEGLIALGGGTPMIDEARALITGARRRGAARVVYLKCSAAELRRRLGAAPGDRPSLTGGEMLEEVEAVLEAREPVYRRLADVVHEAGGENEEASARRLAARLGGEAGVEGPGGGDG